MQPVKIKFLNFWKGFDNQCYVFIELLKKYYNVKFINTRDSTKPDIVFYADRITRKPRHFNPNAFPESIKIFYTGENTEPDLNIFDYSFSFYDTTGRNFQLPNYARQKYYFDFLKYPNFPKQYPSKFCNFLYRNSNAKERIKFCKRLANYKRVDCPGESLNNMQNFTREGRRSKTWFADKRKFIANYKFTIAFENTSARNYITEKMFDPLYAGSIPIYWGAPNVTDFFNPDSFVNVREFKNFDAVVERIKEIDNDNDLYKKMLLSYPIHEISKLKNCTEETIVKRFNLIMEKIK